MRIGLALLGLVFSTALAAGVSLPFSALPAETLISIEGQLVFESVLPGYNYSRPLTVSVALPPGSLDGLNASLVLIYVKLSTSQGRNSVIYFVDETGASKLERFTLTCVVENSACNSSSILSKTFHLVFRLPASHTAYNDEIIVNYSLEPIIFNTAEEQALAIKANLSQIELELNSVKSRLEQNVGENSSEFVQTTGEIQAIIDQARNRVNQLDLDNASRLLDAARGNLTNLSITSRKGERESTSLTTFATSNYQNIALWFGVLAALVFGVYTYFKWKAKKPRYPDYDKLFVGLDK